MLGLEFILLSCSPRMLSTISPSRYENVKKQMERCLDHVIGEVPLLNSKYTNSTILILLLLYSNPKGNNFSDAYTSPQYHGGWSKQKSNIKF